MWTVEPGEGAEGEKGEPEKVPPTKPMVEVGVVTYRFRIQSGERSEAASGRLLVIGVGEASLKEFRDVQLSLRSSCPHLSTFRV